MVLIFTDTEELDRELSQKIDDSRIVYYPEYVLEESEAKVLIATVQSNKYNFKEFMYKVREKNIQVILLLENDKVKELKDALTLGIYDIIFNPFTVDDVLKKVNNPTQFSEVSKYIRNILELDNF